MVVVSVLKAKIAVNSMTIEVEGTSREVASLIRDLHANPPFKGGGAGTTIKVKPGAAEWPVPEDIARHIEGLPGHAHTLEEVMSHFLGAPLASRRDDGSSNPDYLRFAHRVKRAREILGDKGISFEKKKDGRRARYEAL